MEDACFFDGTSWQGIEALDPMNRSALYGDGCFETVKIDHGVPAFWLEHWERFEATAQFLRIPIPLSVQHVSEKLHALLSEQPNLNRLRMTLIRRSGGKYSPTNSNGLLILQLEERLAHDSSAISAAIGQHRLSSLPLSNHKTTSKVNHVLAALEAKDRGVNELILLNERGEVSEFVSGNLFLVKSGLITTPYLNSGCLNGVIRTVLLRGFDSIEEVVIQERDVLAADELIYTNSIVGAAPVKFGTSAISNAVSDRMTSFLEKEAPSSWLDLLETRP